MACPHVTSVRLNVPSPTAAIYKDECTLCFDSPDQESGLDVCLQCFNGGCTDSERLHAIHHYTKSGHTLALNIRRIKKPKRDGEEPPQKITKIAIVPEKDDDLYDYITYVKCYECGGIEVDRTAGQIPKVIDAIMTSLSASRQSEVKAWEEEIVSCAHIRDLVQDTAKVVSAENAHCGKCELQENLWLCMVCGNLGCGRQQYGGVGGNGHALNHFETTGHGVACKLGTITPEGTADIYCYHCNEERSDDHLGKHLAQFGIRVEQQQKTIKSLTELAIEQNQKFNFNMYTEDGKAFDPLFGPGFTGFKNLGNSCYMASILQSVFDLPSFVSRYYPPDVDHIQNCTLEPGKCLQCQLSKVADGLLSGRYATPVVSNEGETQGQDGIAPGMFKALIGRGHEEFSTMRQQDSFEFFQYLLKSITQNERTSGKADPTKTFEFSNEQRLQCLECRKVRYSYDNTTALSIGVPAKKISGGEDGEEEVYEPVTLERCLDIYTAAEDLPYNCPSCQKRTTAIKTNRFATFPETLVLNLRRFEYRNWVPRKLAVPVIVSEDIIDLEKYRGKGRQENEELLPEDAPAPAAARQFNESAMGDLMSMGFPEIRCQKALLATGNRSADEAMEWLLQHLDDPTIDDPIPDPSSKKSGGVQVDAASVQQLTEFGFTEKQATKALKETGGSVERAADWLFSHADSIVDDDVEDNAGASNEGNDGQPKLVGDATKQGRYRLASFVSHKGPSVHCGHYVAHIRKDDRWVLYNDNKVVVDPKAPIGEAYMYTFKRE